MPSGLPPIRYILVQLALIGLIGIGAAVLVPVFARDILGSGPGTLGLLMASSGTDALIGALFLASRKSVLEVGRWIVYGISLLRVGIIAFSFSRFVWLSCLMLLTGFGMIVQM